MLVWERGSGSGLSMLRVLERRLVVSLFSLSLAFPLYGCRKTERGLGRGIRRARHMGVGRSWAVSDPRRWLGASSDAQGRRSALPREERQGCTWKRKSIFLGGGDERRGEAVSLRHDYL